MKTITKILLLTSVMAMAIPAVISQNGGSQLANIGVFIETQMELQHKPGLAAVIIRGDSVIWSGNYGYANLATSLPVSDSTLFNAFSIGKSLTASCVLQLWEEGLLGLDQDINGFLPFQIDNPHVANDSVTARMLMSHTSSIIDFNFNSHITIGDPTESLESFLANYLSPGGSYYSSGNFLAQPPGSLGVYSNFGSALNGYLVEPLTDIAFSAYARNNLLVPLEMYRSAWFLNELNINNLAIGYDYTGGNYQPNPHYGMAAYPGVSLRSNVFELANFLTMLMNGGSFKGVQLLNPATIDSMMTLQPYAGASGLGLNKYFTWNYYNTIQRITWGHNGGGEAGYAGYMRFCPADNTGVVILSNSSTYPLLTLRRLFDYAAMIVIADNACDTTDCSFMATWQEAPDATYYFLDLAFDENFSLFVPGFENFNVGNQLSYEITDLAENTDYYYRLRAVNVHDTGAYSNPVNVKTLLGTGTGRIAEAKMALQIHPNPVTDFVNIEFTLTQTSTVSIQIFNAMGAKVAELHTANCLPDSSSLPGMQGICQKACISAGCRQGKNFQHKS
jgi:CubicO group peptidase (beta-lactamase class C family)